MTEISVVIPLYNHADVLGLCLSALLTQSPPPHEIIIVDDASTDHGLFIANEAAQRHPSIRVFRHEKNRGAPAAINTGLVKATGKYVFFSAADDAVLPGLFAASLAQFKLYPQAGLCCAQIALVNEDLNVIGFRPAFLPVRHAGYINPKQTRSKLKHSDNWIAGHTAVYDRQKLVDMGGFDETVGSLCDGLASRLMALQYGFCFVPEVLAIWRVVASSLSFQNVYDERKVEKSIELAHGWFTRHRAVVPSFYPAVYERRYRFNVAQISVANSKQNAYRKFWLRSLLFLKYRPVSVRALASAAWRHFFRDKGSADAVALALDRLLYRLK